MIQGEISSGRQVEMIVHHLDSILTQPEAAAALLSCLSQPAPDPDVLSGIILSDPALAAKILSLAGQRNLLGPDDRINIDWTVAQMPSRLIRDAVLAVGVFEISEPSSQTNRRRRDLVLHCLATACCAERIAEFVLEEQQRQTAFCAGLLHDIGKFAMEEVMPKSVEQIALDAHTRAAGLSEIEREHLGLDHTVVGKRIAEKWNLPAGITAAIWLHHAAAAAIAAGLPYARIAAVTALADAMARSSGIGLSGSFDDVSATINDIQQALGLSAEQVGRIQKDLPEQVQKRSAFAGVESPRSSGRYYRMIHQTAAGLADENARIVEQGTAAATAVRRLDMIKRFLGFAASGGQVAEAAVHLAGLIRDVFSGGSVVVFVPAPDKLSVEAGYVDRQGRSGSAVAPLRPGQGLDIEMFESGFELAKAGTDALRLFDRLGLSMDLTVAMAAPLIAAGGSVGSVLFEPPPTGVDAQFLETVCATGAAVLSLTCVCRREKELSENLVSVMGRLGRMQKALADARAHDAIAEMAAGAAHELNNPLAVISGRAQILYDEEQDPARKQTLGQIRRRAQEISEILSELMAFARPRVPEKRMVCPLEIVDSAAENTCRKHLLEAVDIEYTGLDALPDVYIDSGHVGTAMENLLSNALQSYPQGNGPVKIEGTFHKTANTVELVVSDKGCGMDSSVLGRAVEPFFSAKPAGRGRGLGLAHADRLLRLNGGSLAIDSKPGLGTTVRVCLPCV